MGRILLVVAVLAITVYALADWVSRSRTWTPGRVNRWAWLALIVLIPLIGPLAWIITGWVTRAEAARSAGIPEEAAVVRPDDDPNAISDLADRIARRQKRTRPEPKKPPRDGSDSTSPGSRFDPSSFEPKNDKAPHNEDDGDGDGDEPA